VLLPLLLPLLLLLMRELKTRCLNETYECAKVGEST